MTKRICIAASIMVCFIFGLVGKISAEESPGIGNLRVFPADNPWNWDITNYSVHPNSGNFIDSIGSTAPLHPDFGSPWQGNPIGIPYVVVGGEEPMIQITYTAYGPESDPGPFPIPLNATIEGGSDSDGDRHVIAVDTSNAMLYELYYAFPATDTWQAASGAKFDLSVNDLRPEGYTSADAAGLPIFPGLVRYEEVYIQKQINHAIRFTVVKSRRAYVWPARHFASPSDNPDFPPMGLRFRLKAAFDTTGFSQPVRVILQALKKHGMIVADNGSNWFISGAPDDRWDNDVLAELKTVKGSDFEAIITVDENGDPIYPISSQMSHINSGVKSITIKNYPNPFNASTIIQFQIPPKESIRTNSEFVTLRVFNIRGKEVATLVSGNLNAGIHDYHFDGKNLASGVYYYQLVAGEYREVKKMIMLK